MKLRNAALPILVLSAGYALADADSSAWSGNMELGYVANEGNTQSTSMTSSADIRWEKEAWRNDIKFNALNTKSEGIRSAEKYFLSDKLAYTFSPKNYVFAYIADEEDRFSGYKYKATVALGYGRNLLDTDTMMWDIETGAGYRRSELAADVIGKDTEESIGRLSSKYAWEISDTATFEEEISVEHGKENTVSKSVTSLKTDITGGFALKVSYIVNYNDEVPDSKVHADKQTLFTLVYSF